MKTEASTQKLIEELQFNKPFGEVSLSQVRALLVDLKDDNLNPDVKGPIMYSS